MYKGRYTKRPIDFSKYWASFFNPYLFNPSYVKSGCGATTLALLTGQNPFKIRKLNGDRGHFSDRFMINFLKKSNYEVIPITKCSVSNHKGFQYPVSENNVLLVSSLTAKKEGSWFVIYNSIAYHNFEQIRISGLDFLNQPILTAYCLFNKKWITEK